MNKWIGLGFLCLSACSVDTNITNSKDKHNDIAGVTFIEQIEREEGKTVIPYSKYILDNGLTVILHEDHSDPLVHVDVTYHVGSAREELGKSGFAHFFEHMMFQGSEHIADEQHIKIVTQAGGRMNGTTNSDRTNYFETVPANQLEKMLWLESDRMGYLLDAVTQEKFEIQRETVKNERRQRVDNVPYGRLNERVNEALYPVGHPYSWQTIGYIEDLNRVNVNDLKAFFLRWYGPNNATITIGGDINTTDTLKLVKQYFQDIPRGPEVFKPIAEPVVLTENRYISMEDNVHLPLVYITFPTVKVRHEDEAPLDLLSTILGQGKTSLFYKNLVKKQIAVKAEVTHPCQELACTFNLYALPHPKSGKSLADVERIIRDTLIEFEQRGVEDNDLIKAKAIMETQFIFGLQSVSGKVSKLAYNQTFTDNPNYIENNVIRYSSVTKEDVMRVYNQYLKGKHSLVTSVVPIGARKLAAPDNFIVPKRQFEQASTTKAEDLNVRKAAKSFNRNIIPTASANKAVDVPVYHEHKMANGIEMLITENTETPTTSILLRIPSGHYLTDKNKAGVAAFTAIMLGESTQIRSGEAMSNELKKLGSSIKIQADNFYINVSIDTLSKHLSKTLELAYEKVLQPAFLENDFERIKRNNIQYLMNNAKKPNFIANEALRKLMYTDVIASIGHGGTVETNNNISLADIKAFYETFVKPSKGKVIAVSDLPTNRIIKAFDKFEQWKGQGPEVKLDFPIPKYKKGHVYLIDKPAAPQSVIKIAKRSIVYDTFGEFYQNNLMNFVLGGAFNSRLNLNLREDKGYSYGAGSNFLGDRYAGQFQSGAQVRADVTGKALVEMINEIKNYAEHGITDDELNFMRKAINQKDALKYETPRAKMGFLAQILEYNLSSDFVQKRMDIVKSIPKEKINELAKKHLNVNDMIILIVGDAKLLKPQLSALGYTVIDHK